MNIVQQCAHLQLYNCRHPPDMCYLKLFFFLTHAVAATHTPDLRRLQTILDQQAEKYNTTLSLGMFHQKFGAFGVASGFVPVGFLCLLVVPEFGL